MHVLTAVLDWCDISVGLYIGKHIEQTAAKLVAVNCIHVLSILVYLEKISKAYNAAYNYLSSLQLYVDPS